MAVGVAGHRLVVACTRVSSPPSSSNRILTLKRSTFSLRYLLALSAAAAVALLRQRNRAFQKISKATVSMSSQISQMDDRSPSIKVIDTHLHVWAPIEQAQTYPYFPGQEPTIPGSVEVLLQAMKEGFVDGALIVQPINHKFDHSYVSSVLQNYPGKFVGCCLADPTDGGGGVVELERLVAKEGYRAVRFNPYLWPSDQKMTNAVGKAMFAKAGQLGVPVGFMCFKGLLLHIAEIEELCSEYPATTVMMDHFGFCKPPRDQLEINLWKCLLNLSKFPNVYVKLSAFFRVSRENYPYRDTWPLVKELIATFGAKRLLWGSDFPYVVDECGYANSKNVLNLAKETVSLSSEDMEWIMGRTAMEVFKGGWA